MNLREGLMWIKTGRRYRIHNGTHVTPSTPIVLENPSGVVRHF